MISLKILVFKKIGLFQVRTNRISTYKHFKSETYYIHSIDLWTPHTHKPMQVPKKINLISPFKRRTIKTVRFT